MLYRNELARRLGLTDVRTAQPHAWRLAQEDPDRLLSYKDPDLCCWIRKVEPLDEALTPFWRWITGRKRVAGDRRGRRWRPSRPMAAGSRSIRWPTGRAATSQPIWRRTACRRTRWSPTAIPRSAACPARRRVKAGEDARAGRWRGSAKVECGIHSAGREARQRHLTDRRHSRDRRMALWKNGAFAPDAYAIVADDAPLARRRRSSSR